MRTGPASRGCRERCSPGEPAPISGVPFRHHGSRAQCAASSTTALRVSPPVGATDRHGTEAARAEASNVKTLRDYRRARGFYFKCGERCGNYHTCPTSVQLQVVEELLELLDIETQEDQGTSLEEEPPSRVVMAISRSTLTSGVPPRAFQLRAWIQGREVLMLVDSGSTTLFINGRLGANIVGVWPLPREYKVRVADGGELMCSASVPNRTWCSHEHQFSTDMKVLPLGVYDAILGSRSTVR